MTIVEMAKRGDKFFTRSGWKQGEFIHAEALLSDESDVPGGIRVCNCHAPILTTDPLMDDDMWMVYEGPEVAQMVVLTREQSQRLMEISPIEILAVLALLSLRGDKRAKEREELKQQMPDLKPWQVSGKTLEA